jgi:5'-nucleotidase
MAKISGLLGVFNEVDTMRPSRVLHVVEGIAAAARLCVMPQWCAAVRYWCSVDVVSGKQPSVSRGAVLVRVLLACLACSQSIIPFSAAAEPADNPWPPPAESVSWAAPGAHQRRNVHLQLLGFNDFHGNLQSPASGATRMIGGAAALAAYLKADEQALPGRTLILHAGDQLGASPPATRLLRNEPGIEFLNLLANKYCHYGAATQFFDASHWRLERDRCNVIGTLGNHEFDAGLDEIHRLLEGGNASDGPFLENPYRGSRVPYVCANVRDRRTGRLLLPPYAVVSLGGIPVGVIGAVLRDTPTIVPAWAVRDVEFLDEAQSINEAAAELQAHGIHTLIVIIHQGLTPVLTDGGLDYHGPLRELVARLDADIDVVISGHTHNFSNVLLPNRAGKPVLVTQAYSYGVAYAKIDLEIDPHTRDVVAKSARIVATWADQPPGSPGDVQAQKLTDSAQSLVAARISRVVGSLARPLTRAVNPGGESALGDLVADSQRAATHADIALTNPGGLRTDLHAGVVSWGDILTVLPFGNHLVTFDMTGSQLLDVLEQQWPSESATTGKILKTSGLYYSWDATKPRGSHIVSACDNDRKRIEPAHHYRVTVNDFLAGGGDDFTRLASLAPGELGPLDGDALAQYLPEHGSPTAESPPRIARADLGEAQACFAAN